MKQILISIRITFFLMLVLGVAYPVAVTLIAQVAFPDKANGSLVYDDGTLRGSSLIAQNFEKPEYFWPRPSAAAFNPLPSGGSNAGPTAKSLLDAAKERGDKLRAANPGAGDPPQHLLFASGSGLDPHQSVAAIQYQAARVAAAREMPLDDLQKLITNHVEGRQLGILGDEIVNVLALNRALDKVKPRQEPPAQEPASQLQPNYPCDSSGN